MREKLSVLHFMFYTIEMLRDLRHARLVTYSDDGVRNMLRTQVQVIDTAVRIYDEFTLRDYFHVLLFEKQDSKIGFTAELTNSNTGTRIFTDQKDLVTTSQGIALRVCE